jgi:hypothetical protein
MAVLGGYAVSKKGAEDPAKREASLTFIDWMTQVSQSQEFVKGAGSMSTVEGAVTPEVADPLVLQIIDEQINGNTGAVGFLEHVTPKAVGEDAIWMGSVGVLTGQLTAQTWMESVEAAAAAEAPTLVLEPSCE